MIEPSTTDNRESTDVVFATADLIQDSSATKRAKTAETLLNILEGRIRNPNTRNAYKAACRSFFEFCSEYKLELDRVKPYHFGLWFKRRVLFSRFVRRSGSGIGFGARQISGCYGVMSWDESNTERNCIVEFRDECRFGHRSTSRPSRGSGTI